MHQTLEIEWFLRERCRDASAHDRIAEAVADLEGFVSTFVLSGFRLIPRPDDERRNGEDRKREHLDVLTALQDGFTEFYGKRLERLLHVSREKMIDGRRAEQFHRYVILRNGSFSQRALHHEGLKALRKRVGSMSVPYNGAARPLSLDRTPRTCFSTSGVTGVIRGQLGASFAKLVENELVTIWHARLATAACGDTASGTALRKLTEALKRTVPFGAVDVGGTWEAFYLVE